MNKNLLFGAKILVSLVLIYFLVRKVDVGQLVHIFSLYSFETVAAVFALFILAMLINTFKWKTFLPVQSFGRLLQFAFIDAFYGMVLPGQFSGEVAKTYRLGTRTGNVTEVAASVWFDKLTGFAGLIVLMIIGLFSSQLSFPIGIYIVAVALLLICISGVLIFRSHRVDFVFEWSKIRFTRINGFLSKIHESIQIFKRNAHSTRLLAVNILLGLLYQFVVVCISVTLANALSIHVPFTDWFWIFGVVSLIQFIPISIAGLGVREASFVGILSIFAVPGASALALSFSIFALQLVFAIIGAAAEFHYTISSRKTA